MNTSGQNGWERAFSLIEVLVACAILAIFTLLLVRVIEAMRLTSIFWGQRIDAETQARMVFDRMAADFSAMVVRPDIDVAFAKKAGNDSFRMLSQVEGLADGLGNQPPRGLSVVEYRMDSANRLERGARALAFSEVVFSPDAKERENALPAPVSLVDGPDNLLPPVDDAGGGQSRFDLFGDQVLRMEIGYLVGPDLKADPPRTAPALFAELPAQARIKDVMAVFVGIATLDARARARLTPAQVNALAGALPDYTQAEANLGRDILSVWTELVEGGSLTALSDIPQDAAQVVRIYQRWFPLQ